MRCSIFIFRSDEPHHTAPHWRLEQAPPDWRLPLTAAGSIRWNAYGVPYIQAANRRDAAVLVGAACYVLRANQIQLFRHVAWGRLAELGGPALVRVDTLIRSLDLHRAQTTILAQMPASTRTWIEGFCEGLNAVASVTPRNREARLMGLHHRPFDVRDVLAIGRLTGTDVNWPMLFDLFPISGLPEFGAVWRRMMQAGRAVPGHDWTNPESWLMRGNRSGSNCLVLDGSRTASGFPLLASDPHLNHQLPNLWLTIGIQCPDMHAVGLMFPGVPVIGLGRNPTLAWGGTNLRAAASDLVHLSAADCQSLSETQTRIQVRFWRTVTRTLRHSTHGPVISDHLGMKGALAHGSIALRWAGHLPSDEITAFLGLMTLRSATGLQRCMQTYGVTGLNVLAADVHGHIAQTHAAWLPGRGRFPQAHFTIDRAQADADWAHVWDSGGLPFRVNPDCGYLLSTNQDPRADIPVSWYFNGEERNRRLRTLVEHCHPVSVQDVQRWHRDVVSSEAAALSLALCQWLQPFVDRDGHSALLNGLRGWSGSYAADSRAALLFEALIASLRESLWRMSLSPISEWWVIQEWAYICNFLLEDCARLTPQQQRVAAQAALKRAMRWDRRYRFWGNVHRLAPRHVLGFLPWVGRRWFPAVDRPASGSRETLMKNAHGWIDGRSRSTYGAQARQICDLSSLDANWFVVLGGQDEAVRSPHAVDQVSLWEAGQAVQMPLSPAAIENAFKRVWHFGPSNILQSDHVSNM